MVEKNTLRNERDQHTFEGYERDKRQTGIRNRILVLPSVICSQIAAERIVEKVPETVCAPHDHGCGQIGADNKQTERTLVGTALNPNITGALVVGLGCEHLQSRELMDEIDQAGLPVREVAIQDVGGVESTIEAGIGAVKELQSCTFETDTKTHLRDLTVGVICSDLQHSSLSVAEPLVGSFVETVINAGGRALVASGGRIQSHQDEIRQRAVNKNVAETFDDIIRQSEYLPSTTTRIHQKAADHGLDKLTTAWRGEPIKDMLRYGEVATYESGLALVHSPSHFAEAATALTASGAQLLIHVTGEGVTTGHPIAPVLKVTGNESTYQALKTDIDINAAETTPDEFQEFVMKILNGKRTGAEKHEIDDFAITRIGPSM